MALDALVSAERVRVDVVARSKKHALEMVAELLAGAYPGLSGNAIFDALVAREKLGCTSLGHGIALPHAALASVETGAVATLKLREPLNFDDDDGSVNLIVAMVIPATGQGVSNDILQQACDLLSEGDYRHQLMQAQTAAQLYAALRGELPASQVRQASG
jgi:PTS system nitrogen regulatory IIA component